MTKPWKEFRQEIVRLYIQEGRTLRDVQGIMRRQHGFNASIRSYRQQFDHWGVGKYKCKRRPRHIDYSGIGLMSPPSPPATPKLPPMAMPYADQKPPIDSLASESGGMDYCWPAQRPHVPLDNRESHPSRSHSVSLPVSAAPGRLAATHDQSRPYQAPRIPLPMMSTHHDPAPGWMSGRPAYSPGEANHRDSAPYCTPRPPPHSPNVRDTPAPVYAESKPAMLGNVAWIVPRSAAYSLTGGDMPSYHGSHDSMEHRARPLPQYPPPGPCALVAAKGFGTSSHLPIDRINVFGRGA